MSAERKPQSEWVDLATVTRLLQQTPRQVRRLAARHAWHYRDGERAGTRGPSPKKYRLADLPADAQRRYSSDRLRGAPVESLTLVPRDTLQAALFYPADERGIKLALKNAEQVQANKRLAAIRPLIRFRESNTPIILTRDGAPFTITNLKQFATWQGSQLTPPASWRTLLRWLARYDTEGYLGLADRIRSDKDKSHFFKQYPAAGEFVRNQVLNFRASIQTAYEELLAEWPRLYNHGSDAPSYNTVRAFIQRLPKAQRVLAERGEEAYDNEIAHYILPDYWSVAPMQIWVSDHVWHDAFVRNDLFREVEANKPMRLWMTAFMDWRSRKIVGCCWFPTPSSFTIASALRMALSKFGAPAEVLFDNGKDYQKIEGQEEQSLGLLHQLGIKVHHSLPYSPQSKNIERFFRTLHLRFDKLWMQYYAGTSSKDRPEACDDALALHDRWMKNKDGGAPLPPASEFILCAARWIDQYNATHVHTGRGMNRRTPDDVFNELCPPERHQPLDVEKIAHLFWDRNDRVVSEGGCVSINDARYEPADAFGTLALMRIIGDRITVARDPADLGFAVAMSLDGNFIGRMRCQELVARGPVSRPQVQAEMRVRNRIRTAVRRENALLLQRRIGAGDQPALDRLRAGIGLAPLSASTNLPSPQPPTLRPELAASNPEPTEFIDDLAERFAEGD